MRAARRPPAIVGRAARNRSLTCVAPRCAAPGGSAPSPAPAGQAARTRPATGWPARRGRTPAHDYDGPVDVSYAPTPDGQPDPGEVVWTWVPYEEDAAVGKDRPVVVIGRALDRPGHEPGGA